MTGSKSSAMQKSKYSCNQSCRGAFHTQFPASVVPELVPVVVLYINAAFAVKEAEEKVTSEKSVKAVVPVKPTPVLVRVSPPAV